MGSLVAALGSYLHARSKQAEWLVRMEDIDPPREQPGAADSILSSLQHHGLYWDGEVMYQSRRSEAYEASLSLLEEKGLLYYCTCSRKQISDTAAKGSHGTVYPGHCRSRKTFAPDAALRIVTSNQPITTRDQVQGEFSQNLGREIGDFVVKRRDGLYAYHLAVVTDDAEQGITEIVRGVDLLDSTPRQQYLQQCMGLPAPEYAHLPIVKNNLGQKLSKQTHAPALDNNKAAENLVTALTYLGQSPPKELLCENVDSILQWAVGNWDMGKVQK